MRIGLQVTGMIAASAIHSGMLGSDCSTSMMRWTIEVEQAAVIAGEPADDDAEHEADGDADQADGERDARAVDDARQHVAAEPVGAEQEELAALGRADEVEVAFEQPPELVAVAAAEEADRLHVVRVVGVFALQRVHVELHGAAVDERPDEAALMEEMDALRRRVDEVDVARVQIVGRQELADQDHDVEHGEEDAASTAPAGGA